MAKIQYIKDKENVTVYPVTHERAVRDSNNVTLETKLGQKQETLVSGTNIKTINNESILGSGNITAGDPNAVKYTSQTLTDAQKTQARTNIGATGPEVFVAIYGTTTYAEITGAIADGKVVVVKRVLNPGTDNENIVFYGSPDNILNYAYIFSRLFFDTEGFGSAIDQIGVDISDAWGESGQKKPEDASYKVSSWSSVPNDYQYPTEKLVKDSLDGKQPTIDASHKLDYSLLSNTPTIPAAQVNADWNANSGVAQILNKPTIPTDVVKYTSQSLTDGQKEQARTNIGAYQKPATGIPASDIASGVIQTVPAISTDVSADATSDVKTSSPKSVKTYVDAGIAAVESNLSNLEDMVGAIDIGAYEVAWDGSSTPVVSNIPAGVIVAYGGTNYTGTLVASASTIQKIYLVATGTTDNYDRYITVGDSTYSWANLGTTEIILADYATKIEVSQLEYKVDALIEGGTGNIVQSDYPTLDIAIYGGDTAWQDVSWSTTVRGEIIPLRTGTTYTVTFANGLGGYAVVLDANPVAGATVRWASGYSTLINTTRDQVVTIQGVTGQYLFVRADPDPNGRVFPVIDTQSADPLVVLRSEVEEMPTQDSNGVVKSGGLYTLFNTINSLLSSIAEVLPVQKAELSGRYDIPMSEVTFLNKVPGYYGGSETKTYTTRVITNIIPIPNGATRINATIATGYRAILYFLRNDSTWDSNAPASGSWSNSPSLDVPESFVSAGAILYMSKDDGSENISTTEAYNAVSALYYDVPETVFVPVSSKEMAQKTISILFIGNSLTQDAVSYVPWLIRNLYPSLDFKLYVWYNGGYTLAQQYTKFVNNQTCEIFSVCENKINWQNSNNAVTMSNVLSTYQFDIVCLQEYFNYKQSYTEADLVDFNNVVSYIRSNYNRNFKVVSLFHAPKRGSGVDGIFNLTKSGNELILKKTSAQSLIAPGVAIYRALSTTLNNLGDQGSLSTDGTHTQEGLPCLLQAWVVFMWIMRQLSIPISIENCQIKMTTAVYNTLNVPGANLGTGVIEGTQAENWLAQDVAILGDKEGCGIETESYLNM